jgi:fluoroquinolone resistance protein
MEQVFVQDKIFDKIDELAKGEYDSCTFKNCNFSNKDLSQFAFTDCTFNSCDFSLVKLNKTSFRDVQFKDCKMLGLRFDTCNDFGLSFSFTNCQLNHSSFYKSHIVKTVFKDSQLEDVDFAEADLTASIFDNCNLLQAIFDRTILEKADLRTSYNYFIDPEVNQIKKAKFSVDGLVGLLAKYDIIIEK